MSDYSRRLAPFLSGFPKILQCSMTHVDNTGFARPRTSADFDISCSFHVCSVRCVFHRDRPTSLSAIFLCWWFLDTREGSVCMCEREDMITQKYKPQDEISGFSVSKCSNKIFSFLSGHNSIPFYFSLSASPLFLYWYPPVAPHLSSGRSTPLLFYLDPGSSDWPISCNLAKTNAMSLYTY